MGVGAPFSALSSRPRVRAVKTDIELVGKQNQIGRPLTIRIYV